MKISIKGKVYLVGAGPGDPDLISLKALKILKTADVILVDRLVSPLLVEKYAKKEADIIYVGKQCSKGIHTPQEFINQSLVEFALNGKTVLRLKGGDVSLFSNVLDELKVLVDNKINYELVPGVSAAFGAAAYSGIPLTARGYSKGVRLLTLCDLSKVSKSQWLEWARTEDTLVFYMSGQKLSVLSNQLLNNGIDKTKSIAIIEQATTPDQKTTVLNFREIEKNELPEFEYVPTLIIVGDVVNLHQEFAWFAEKKQTESYFDNHKTLLKNAI